MSTRYDLMQTDVGGIMEPSADGYFVLYSDFAQSESRRKELVKVLNNLLYAIDYADGTGGNISPATVEVRNARLVLSKEPK